MNKLRTWLWSATQVKNQFAPEEENYSLKYALLTNSININITQAISASNIEPEKKNKLAYYYSISLFPYFSDLFPELCKRDLDKCFNTTTASTLHKEEIQKFLNICPPSYPLKITNKSLSEILTHLKRTYLFNQKDTNKFITTIYNFDTIAYYKFFIRFIFMAYKLLSPAQLELLPHRLKKFMTCYQEMIESNSFESLLMKNDEDFEKVLNALQQKANHVNSLINARQYLAQEFENDLKLLGKTITINQNRNVCLNLRAPNIYSMIINGQKKWNPNLMPISISLTPYYNEGTTESNFNTLNNDSCHCITNEPSEIFKLIGVQFGEAFQNSPAEISENLSSQLKSESTSQFQKTIEKKATNAKKTQYLKMANANNGCLTCTNHQHIA